MRAVRMYASSSSGLYTPAKLRYPAPDGSALVEQRLALARARATTTH
jgi:hypothetical protein